MLDWSVKPALHGYLKEERADSTLVRLVQRPLSHVGLKNYHQRSHLWRRRTDMRVSSKEKEGTGERGRGGFQYSSRVVPRSESNQSK